MQEQHIDEMSAEAILDELSYSIASPVAKDITEAISQKNFKYAKEMLLEEKISEKEVEIVLNHFKDKQKQNFVFEEISVSDIDKKDFQQCYLFRIGEGLTQAQLCNDRGNKEPYFFYHSGMYTLSKVDQAWKVLKK